MQPEILNPILILGVFGLLFGLGLSLAGKLFYVKVDPRVESAEGMLPGANCGGCGYPGCAGFAEAIVAGEAVPSMCVAASDDAVKQICCLLGIENEEVDPIVAVVKCRGDMSSENSKYDYMGRYSCAEAILVAEGPNPCRYGCLGMGSCVKACKFDAIRKEKGQPPVVDRDDCVACGACVKACPKQLIEIAPYSRNVVILCCNHDKGKSAKEACSVSCIGCGICAKKCPEEAIEMVNDLPVIDYEKCTDCGTCANACPRSAISGGEKKVKIAAEVNAAKEAKIAKAGEQKG